MTPPTNDPDDRSIESQTMRVIVSGKTYYACMDPQCSSVPGEHDWPTASLKKVGRGIRADYGHVPLSVAKTMLDHLWTIGPSWVGGDDPGTRAEGRAIVKDLNRLEGIEKQARNGSTSATAAAVKAAHIAPDAPRPTWVCHDGGRAEAGYLGSTGDCVTRAIAIAAEMPYQHVYDLVNDAARRERPRTSSRRKGKRSSARTGVYKPTTRRILEQLGWQWVPTMSIGSGCTVHLRADELPTGRLVVQVSKHVVAMIDGVVYDNHDSTRDGTRCVYGYYRAHE